MCLHVHDLVFDCTVSRQHNGFLLDSTVRKVLLECCETNKFDIPSYSRYWPAIVQFLQ